jgi:hypothetical protein
MKAPFPWFGGKSRVAHLVWGAFGDCANYVEPFFGSGAVLLGRPHAPRIETVNDKDCYLANFWRATKYAPEEVARWADWPVNEIDLHARHLWLVGQVEFRERMRADPEFFDARVAGWWVWGICQWIGAGWCSESNWDTTRPASRGRATAEQNGRPDLTANRGVHRRTRDLANSSTWQKRPSLGKGARGVQRVPPPADQVPMLSGSRGAAGRGVHASGLAHKLPLLSAGSGTGTGVHSKMIKMDRGTASRMQGPVFEWMRALSERLRRVRVCCGDWKRILGRSSTELIGVTGVFLDPPYLAGSRDPSLYGTESADVAHAVREWALANGNNKKLRIALCGYEGEHEMPGWQKVAWEASGGYAAAAGNTVNAGLERIWFSPHCSRAADQGSLFGGAA